ncbi:hypothetical protein TW95_gp0989 [Pandoravirus inopinatum]|uniref:Uncharacterized protein n=1 Tax=Pandoravirus inopinatum TaxID=1605721 RepID=A0A0B5IY31_9VIRU|nr:hypothetical protein TW95_gp0989 [Pandoravirus inopinatum]AJF97723.1 hypothetical protein [Pandoravirus inopinatum]
MERKLCVASVALLALLAVAMSAESQAVYGGALRLYQADAMSYCFADDRMAGAPLTCVAVPYLKDAHVFALGRTADDTRGNNGVRISLPVSPASLSIIETPATDTWTNVTLRLCQPDPATGRIMCPAAATVNNDDVARPWLQLSKVADANNNGADRATDNNLYSGDLVVMRSLLDGVGGADCGLVDNVLTCDGTASSLFRIIV